MGRVRAPDQPVPHIDEGLQNILQDRLSCRFVDLLVLLIQAGRVPLERSVDRSDQFPHGPQTVVQLLECPSLEPGFLDHRSDHRPERVQVAAGFGLVGRARGRLGLQLLQDLGGNPFAGRSPCENLIEPCRKLSQDALADLRLIFLPGWAGSVGTAGESP